MIILGVDLGEARTGIAVCDKFEMLATPVCVIKQADETLLVSEIAQIAAEKSAEEIVVGLPKNMDSSEGERAQKCTRLAAEIERISGIKTSLRDERLTTVSAHNALNLTNTRGKKRKAAVDQVAATVILQEYLDYRRLHNNL